MMTKKMMSKSLYSVGLAILLSASLIACSDEGSSNSSDDDDSSNVNATRVIETPNGPVTVRRDPNDEDIRIIDAGTTTNLTLNCGSGNTTFQFGDSEVDVCSE